MKTETQSNAATETVAPSALHPAIRILKIATCPSMSGKSQLTYHLGCTADSKILFRIYGNTASGYFSKEWVAVNTIQELFGKATDAKAITSFALHLLFKGKSINTPAFLFAALLNEGLVQPSTTTKRCYECTDGKKFFAAVDALFDSTVDLTDELQKVEAKQGKSKAAKTVTGKEQPAVAQTKKTAGKGQSIDSKMKAIASEMSIPPSPKKASKKVSMKAA